MKPIYLSIAFALVSITTFGQNANLNLDRSNKAVQGYDVVSYFKEGKAVKGKKDISYSHDGVIYSFKDENNKKLFSENPAMYPIKYGGWCAYAMGVNGDKVKIDPETFKIIDNELYLFYNFYFNNTLEKWNEDEAKYKPVADSNWEKISKN